MSAISTRTAPVSRLPWRTIGAVALLMLALVVGAVALIGSRQKPLPAPFGVAANGVILNVAEGDVLARETLNGPARTLIDVDLPVVGPWPTPDGTRFSYLTINPNKTLDIWVANIDGTGGQKIAGPYVAPDAMEWSPSGDVLAVGETPTTGDPYIDLVRTDGSGITRLDVGMPAALPQWRAPDGARLFIVSPSRAGALLSFVDPNDGSVTPLDLDPRLEIIDPVLSPDGNRVTFFSPIVGAPGLQGAGLQVHVVDLRPDGTVLADRILPHRDTDADYDASFLPDGRLVFWRNHAGSYSLQVASADDLDAPAIDLRCCRGTDGGSADVKVMASPDGRQLLLFGDAYPFVRSLDIATGKVADTTFTTEDLVVMQRVVPRP